MTEQHREDLEQHVEQAPGRLEQPSGDTGQAAPEPDDLADHGDDVRTSAEDTSGHSSSGNPEVDGVLASLEALPERPVDEHVEVFERAHETLRRTLNDAGDQG